MLKRVAPVMKIAELIDYLMRADMVSGHTIEYRGDDYDDCGNSAALFVIRNNVQNVVAEVTFSKNGVFVEKEGRHYIWVNEG